MKNFFKEFKEFISKGNVMSMAVGIIIGGAFTAIINAIVADFLTPLLSVILGGFDMTSAWCVQIKLPWVKLAEDGSYPTMKFGDIVQAIITFLITAFVLFLIIKAFNKMTTIGKKKEEEAAPTTKICPHCKSEINIEATKCPFCTSDLSE